MNMRNFTPASRMHQVTDSRSLECAPGRTPRLEFLKSWRRHQFITYHRKSSAKQTQTCLGMPRSVETTAASKAPSVYLEHVVRVSRCTFNDNCNLSIKKYLLWHDILKLLFLPMCISISLVSCSYVWKPCCWRRCQHMSWNTSRLAGLEGSV